MKLDIATGKHRNAKTWQNKSVEYEEIVKKCSVTHHTPETVAEYMAAPKSRQDEIKDIGGFVGGYLAGGRRKRDTVNHRQLITLDADFATKYFWDDFTMVYGCAGFCYSTHKHTPDAPRLRLVLPLDRPVTAAEYEPIARRIAESLGIEQIDHTTYDVNRLMYWPSTSKDGEFFFAEQDGDWLEADKILATYHHWQDASEWPVSQKEAKAIMHGIKKQGDPLEKEGLVGAFCRVYDIHSAIETFLSDEYEPCDIENRYTFKEGSTAAGLITYEDKFAFSHHGTDPISGKLCNAFDLVRIHKFGTRDENSQIDTPTNRLPSYLAMVDFAGKDAAVKKMVVSEKIQQAGADFADALPEPEDYNDDWLSLLDVDRKGKLFATIKNFRLIMENDPALKGCMAFDQFAKMEAALRDLPWRKAKKGEFLTDVDSSQLREYIESKYDVSCLGSNFSYAETNMMANNGFHPIKQYLGGLVWDGMPRVDTLLSTYLGAEDNELTRAMSRKVLAAAVTRIYEPGAKFDYVLTFSGDEGIRKSTFINILGGEWFSDSFGDISKEKSAEESLQGVWFMEVGELEGFKRGSVEKVKHFITKRDDQFRVAYGKRKERFPRQCIFFATTNEPEFLIATTGNRRFWIVDVYKVWSKELYDQLIRERDQIWAEAVTIYKTGELLYLSEELEEEAKKRQESKEVSDPRDERIQWYLDKLLPTNWDDMGIHERRGFLAVGGSDLQPDGTIQRTKVCAAEIWVEAFDGTAKDMNAYQTRFIKDYMRRKAKGWEAYKSNSTFGTYGEQRGYFRTYKQVENNVQNVQSPKMATYKDVQTTYN